MRTGLLLLIMATILLFHCSTTQQIKPGPGTTLKDGVYVGEESGWPDMKVEVTIEADCIQNVRFIESNGTAVYNEMVVPVLPKRMIEEGYADVEGITGATLSSDNFLSAVRNAVEKARR